MQNASIDKMSFEKKRAAMARALIKNSKGPVITRTVPFTNNDVPEFLEQLNQFGKESKKVKIIVEASHALH